MWFLAESLNNEVPGLFRMGRRFVLLLLISLSLAVPFAAGTLVHGTVYDLSLEPVIGAIVEVDTAPAQRYLTKDGSYSFELSAGTYTLKATQFRDENTIAFVEESIVIESDGSFVLDLILYPKLTEESEIYDPASLAAVEDDFGAQPASPFLLIAALSGVVAALVVFFIVVWTKRWSSTLERIRGILKRTESVPDGLAPEVQKALTIIESSGGRISQKELRREFPYSEAKVSLMITELEGRGLVKKFKKGRGNVLVLVGGKEDR